MRLQIQAADISFVWRVSGFTLWNRVRSSVIVSTTPQQKKTTEVVLASGQDASMGRCFGHIPPDGGFGADPGLAGEIMSLGCLENTSVSPQKSWRRWLGRSGV